MENTTTTLIADLRKSAVALKKAKTAFVKATLAHAVAERNLNNKRNAHIASGQIQGKNEAERNAQLASLLVDDILTVDVASDDMSIKRLAYDLANIDHQVNRYAIRAIVGDEEAI